MSSRPTFYILDALSLIYQVFHAISAMSGPAGQPTNAVFGVFRDLLNLRRDKKPDYLAVAHDGPGPVFRSDIFPEYKAQRPDMPQDLRAQIPVILDVYRGFRVPVWEVPNYEADDIIATLARRGEERGLDVFVCTADKDARQLLSERIKIYNLRKNEILDTEKLRQDWGVTPGQVVDLLALTGDAVDNVPGVPGIGIKTGAQLLTEYGDLETLLAKADSVKGPKKKEALKTHADIARRARTLITLKDDLDLKIDWDALKLQEVDAVTLRTLCVDNGFHRFLEELPQPPETPWDLDRYRCIDTPELFETFVAALEAQTRFAFDTETTGLDPYHANLVGLSFSWNEAEAYYLPVKAPMWCKTLPRDEILARLKPILENPATEKIAQNWKFDWQVLNSYGITVAGPLTDTMVLSYLLESGERNHNLNELARRYLQHTMVPIEKLIGKGKDQRTMDQVETELVTRYAGEDADAAWRLEGLLSAEIRTAGLTGLYETLERPLIRVLARMEHIGIKVETEKLRALSKDFASQLEILTKEVYRLAGGEFNVNSTLQLRKVLFEDLKLPVRYKTPKGEPSTAVEVLEDLATRHPLPKLLIKHRQLEKLKNTYLDALPGLVHPGDGRIHASFHQTVAATGRLSSSDPNLQNIPVRTEEGRQIRQAFVPGHAGWELLTADYSQIELRVLAHYCTDPALCAAFAADHDIHSEVAARVFKVPLDAVTSDQRRVAKTVNFGVIYGLSAYGLAERLGIPQDEAEQFINSYFDGYPGVETFITKVLEHARDHGRVETLLGRHRAINGIKQTTGRNRNQAERTAINTVIQGSAADLIKQAMIRVDDALTREGFEARMLLQIHDELVFEAPRAEIPRLAALVNREMTQALSLKVPIKVDVAHGPNWLDVVDLDVKN